MYGRHTPTSVRTHLVNNLWTHGVLMKSRQGLKSLTSSSQQPYENHSEPMWEMRTPHRT